MADVKGAGDTGMRENPKVTSKFDRMHGHPRTPGKVEHPGGTASPGTADGTATPKFSHERIDPSSRKHGDNETRIHHYAVDHPAMGGLHQGKKAKHPMHDGKQASYEKNGYGGKR